MAEYKSKFARLSFYVKGERKQFSQGRYSTEDKDEITVLDGLPDAQKVEASEVPKPKAQPKQTEEKAEAKAAPKRKPAATSKSTKPKTDKSSGK